MENRFALLAFVLCLSLTGQSQVLHTENFNVILDTTKRIKGSFTPNFRFRNLQEEYLELENTTDLSILIKNHGITGANRLEYALFGNESLMSGGFLYLEYQNIRRKSHLAFEPFVQIHWQEIRGLDRKYSGGMNLRWRAKVTTDFGLYVGLGALYEYERWNPAAGNEEVFFGVFPEVQQFRGCSYLSLKKQFGENFVLDISGYYQPKFEGFRNNYRLAGSWEVIYNFSKYIGLSLLYQNIYDSNPVISIDPLFHDVNLGLTFTF